MPIRRLHNSAILAALLTSLVIFVGAVAVAASDSGQADGPVSSLQRLKADYPEAREYKAGDMITRIYGTPFAQGDSPEEAAEMFIREYSGIWGVGARDLVPEGLRKGESHVQPLMYRPESDDYKFSLVTYRQYSGDVSVFSSELKLLVRNEPGFPVVMASSSLRDLKGFKPDGAAAARQSDVAVAAARQAESGLTRFTEQEPVIWAGDGEELAEPRLAVKFFGYSDEGESFLFIADATTGEILQKYDLVFNVTISGTVQGMATDPNAADICNPESMVPMPYSLVQSPYGATYTDSTGYFQMTTDHTGSFDVYSYLRGPYFRAITTLGSTSQLIMTMNPPDTGTFVHNAANDNEYLRAQVNAYYYANEIRDWVMRYNPSYPGVYNQGVLPLYVNSDCGSQGCGAVYYYMNGESSFSFCASSTVCSNAAFQPIVQHEYGHFLQVMAGILSSGPYHEGVGDCLAVIYADEPRLGLGLEFDCAGYNRTADNDFQFPCEGGYHYCGQLLSGCVWSTRNELVNSGFGDYQQILADLMINSILLKGNDATIKPNITIDWLILDDDDASLANGTPHYDEIAAGFAAHNMAPPRFKYLSTIPDRNAKDMSTTTPIVATFDGPMSMGTVNDSTVKVYSRYCGFIPGTVTCYPESNIMVFQPIAPLKEGDLITVTLSGSILDTTLSPFFGGYGYNWSFTVENCATGDFHQLGSFPLSYRPGSSHAGDLNGDGAIDIVMANANSDVIAILYNDGAGSLGNETIVTMPAGSSPTDVKTGDFDGDGDLDLALSCYGSSSVQIWENNGAFSLASELQTAYLPKHLHPGDLDNDGDLDLAVNFVDTAAGKSRYGSLSNNGSAVFSAGPYSDVEYGQYVDVTLGDMNNDGELDPVYMLPSLGRVKMIVRDNNGAYNDTVLRTIVDPSSATLHDLNGNGSLDLAVASRDTDSMLIIQGQGLYEFGPYDHYGTGGEPRAIVSSDFDSDGDIDVAIANRLDDSVVVYWNDGAGGFATQSSFTVGDGPWDMFAADFDNDGSIDIATANVDDTTISILYNFGTPAAPTLYSPVNGKTFTEPASPLLNCNDVPSGTFYWFQIDDNSDFSSPIAQQYWNHVSEWQVPVDLYAGTYYWRASAATQCGFGDWSEAWHIVVEPVLPSCPVLFAWNGDEFVQDNPLLTACEASGYVDVVTDYYLVNKPVEMQNGQVLFELRELEDEITYLEDFQLVTVDHSASTKAACSPDGRTFTYETSVAPISAIDDAGEDWTQELAADDGRYLSIDRSGSLTLTFPAADSDAGIEFLAPTKPPCPCEAPCKQAPLADIQTRSLTVEVLGSDGAWHTLPEAPLRVEPTDAYMIYDEAVSSRYEQVKVRISWEGGFAIDEIRQYVEADETPTVRTFAPNELVVEATNPAAKGWSSFDQSGMLELHKGETVQFTFDVEESANVMLVRDYIVVAKGRYEPDYNVYTHLMPGQFQLYHAYPNPFNPMTTIQYDLPRACRVKLEIFNVLGQSVATLVDQDQAAGHYQAVWDASSAASGVYLYRLQAEDFIQTLKMTLLK